MRPRNAVPLGEVAIGLCVIAAAFVGFTMLSGPMALRDGLRVGIGCFVLPDAPALAMGLHAAAEQALAHEPVDPPRIDSLPAPAPLASPNHDPYARPSLRRD